MRLRMHLALHLGIEPSNQRLTAVRHHLGASGKQSTPCLLSLDLAKTPLIVKASLPLMSPECKPLRSMSMNRLAESRGVEPPWLPSHTGFKPACHPRSETFRYYLCRGPRSGRNTRTTYQQRRPMTTCTHYAIFMGVGSSLLCHDRVFRSPHRRIPICVTA
jgi:hypothetical protein